MLTYPNVSQQARERDGVSELAQAYLDSAKNQLLIPELRSLPALGGSGQQSLYIIF